MSLHHHPTALDRGAAHDVIVVGAQPAGLATAMLLARQGLRTVVVDRRAHRPDGDVPLLLLRAGVLLLARWGLLDSIAATGAPPVSRTTFRYGRETDTMSVKPSHGVSAFYAPCRGRLSTVLEAAAAGAGVELQRRVTVTGVITRHDRVVGVRAVTADHRTVELQASAVIGADGTGSTIARAVGATPTRRAVNAAAATYAYWPGHLTDSYDWTFTPHARIGVVPTDAGRTCVFVSASPDRIGTGGVALIRDAVAAAAPDLAERLRAHSATGEGTAPARTGFIRRSHGPGWALVGTAGYAKDPLSAHGSTDALRDAELLARAVVTGHATGAMDDALAAYEDTRDRLGRPVFDVVDRLGQWAGPQTAELLVQLRSTMADEVETLAALEPEHVP